MSSELQNDQQADGQTINANEPTITLPGYEVLGVLGTGGMSTVYKARQEQMGRVVATKVLHRYLAKDLVHLQRFRQEARLSTALEHPNIAKLYAFDRSADGQPYLVMEYCEGQTLREMMDKNHSFSWAEIQEIFLQVCAGIAHAHGHGIVHRDLKPANVFIQKNSVGKSAVKLIDFGIAKLDATDPEVQKLTQTGVIVGSPHYMSPEQCLGDKVDGRADIYATGCMLYHLLAGRPPFVGDSHFELAQKHVSELAPPISEICTSIDPELEKVIQKALEKRPEDRFQTIGEFRDAIAAIRTNVSAVRPSLKIKVPKIGSRRVVVTLCLLAVPCLAALAGVMLLGSSQPHSVQFETAHQMFNQGRYEQAFPLLVKAQDFGNLSDDEASRLILDFCDFAYIFNDERNMLDRIHWAGIEPSLAAGDAAVQPMPNHIDKLTLCEAQLAQADNSGGSRQEHVRNTFDMTGLNWQQMEYCRGRMAYTDAVDYQGRGKWTEAESSYVEAIAHLQKADSPEHLARAYLSFANYYADGKHVDQFNRAYQNAYELLPKLIKRDGRLTARDIAAITAFYLIPNEKFNEAHKALERVHEIYSKTAGGSNDFAQLYETEAELVGAETKDDKAQLQLLTKALAYRANVNTGFFVMADWLSEKAALETKLQLYDDAVASLQRALSYAQQISKTDMRLIRTTRILDQLCTVQTEAGKLAQAGETRKVLIEVMKRRLADAKEEFLNSGSMHDAKAFHSSSFGLASQLCAAGRRPEARDVMSADLKTLEKTVPMSRVYADCYFCSASVQDDVASNIACIEKAEQIMSKIARNESDRQYLLEIQAALGCVYESNNRAKESLPLLETVEEAMNKPKAVRAGWRTWSPYALANAYAKLDRKDDALTLYQTIMTPPKLKQYKGIGVVEEAKTLYHNLLAPSAS